MTEDISKPAYPVDVEFPDVTINKLAFGSCHKNKKAVASHLNHNIWNAISALQPDAFLFTGDAIYSPNKSGAASLEVLEQEYNQMKNNSTIGFSNFLLNAQKEGFLKGGYHATLDDHDYGANDCGEDLPQMKERQHLFLDFLDVDIFDERRSRNGVYSTVTYGTAPRKTKLIFLDTRSGRSKHCIPSVGAWPFPFGLGSAFACITRWFSSALNLQNSIPSCKSGKMLDEEQWDWLEHHIIHTDAQVNIVISSIQVLTTNKFFESWGQFPSERTKFVELLNRVEENKSVVLLSGDVHHGEILDSSRGVKRHSKGYGRLIEVTSSGLTHSCEDPFYGFLCKPILNQFDGHRLRSNDAGSPNYYTKKNFGMLDIDWIESKIQINVHDNLGKPVLSTGSLPFSEFESNMSNWQINQVLSPVDGSMMPFMFRCLFAIGLVIVSIILRRHLFKMAFEKVTQERKEKKQ